VLGLRSRARTNSTITDEDLEESAPTDQAQPPRRMTKSMTQDTGLGQDSPATTSTPSLPQRITRSRAQALGVEHELVSLFLILVE